MNAFVVESTTALAQANALLRRHGEPELPDPPCTARMLGFLKEAQGALNGRPRAESAAWMTREGARSRACCVPREDR